MDSIVELKPLSVEKVEQVEDKFNLNIDNYEGPLELLLDLAKSQKVDLMKISIVQLADEYLKFINNIKKNLELAADFLVMATWLAYLKSRLLLPDDFEDDFSAIQMAEKLKLQLRKLEAIRFLSDKLVSQKQLGRDIFTKGIREGIKKISTSKYAVSLYELIKSYAEIKRKQNFSIMNISKLPVYTMEEAIKKITSLLKDLTDWRDIKDVVPGSFSGSKNLKKSGLELQSEFIERGINLYEISNKWSFRTAENLSKKIASEVVQQRKLSKATIETLAIIAYHQPVTRSEIEEIRGVSFSTGTLEILFELGWVKPQGRKEIPGKPLLYVTTDTFLSHFNLKSLSDLPNSEELASAGLIDSRLDRSIFGTNKFAKDDLDKQSKEDIFSNIDDMLSETLNQKDN